MSRCWDCNPEHWTQNSQCMFENEFYHIISRDSRDSGFCIELRIPTGWEKLSRFHRILLGKMRYFELISKAMSSWLSSVPDKNPAHFLQHRVGVWRTRLAQLCNESARILRGMNFCYPPVFQTCPEARPTSIEKKSIGLKFSKSRTGSDVRYCCHHNSSRVTFPIFARSWRFSVFHSVQ